MAEIDLTVYIFVHRSKRPSASVYSNYFSFTLYGWHPIREELVFLDTCVTNSGGAKLYPTFDGAVYEARSCVRKELDEVIRFMELDVTQDDITLSYAPFVLFN